MLQFDSHQILILWEKGYSPVWNYIWIVPDSGLRAAEDRKGRYTIRPVYIWALASLFLGTHFVNKHFGKGLWVTAVSVNNRWCQNLLRVPIRRPGLCRWFPVRNATNSCICTNWTRRFARIAKSLRRSHVGDVGNRSPRDMTRHIVRNVTRDVGHDGWLRTHYGRNLGSKMINWMRYQNNKQTHRLCWREFWKS